MPFRQHFPELPRGKEGLVPRQSAARHMLKNDGIIGGCQGLQMIIDSLFEDLCALYQVHVAQAALDHLS